MNLHTIKKTSAWERTAKRVGRGGGSGKGWHTTGKGNKGQKARSGAIPVGFEGGQVPLFKRLPQIGGFKNMSAKKVFSIALSDLNVFENGTEVTKLALQNAGILPRSFRGYVKVLGSGEVTKKLVLKDILVSSSAKIKLEKTGSTFTDAKRA